MVAAHIAVFWRLDLLSRRFVLKDLEVGSILTAKETQLSHNGARIDVQVLRHPIAVGDESTDFENELAADHVDKKRCGLLQVRHRESHMLCSSQARQAD